MVTIGKRMLPSLEGTLKSTGKALLDMVKEAAAPPPRCSSTCAQPP